MTEERLAGTYHRPCGEELVAVLCILVSMAAYEKLLIIYMYTYTPVYVTYTYTPVYVYVYVYVFYFYFFRKIALPAL